MTFEQESMIDKWDLPELQQLNRAECVARRGAIKAIYVRFTKNINSNFIRTDFLKDLNKLDNATLIILSREG